MLADNNQRGDWEAISLEGVKQCGACREIKPLSEFYRNKSTKDGMCGQCKVCCKVYKQSEKCKANKKACRQTEKYKANKKAYRQTEKYKANKKAYRQTEKYKANMKAYRQTEKYKANMKAYTKKAIEDLSDRYLTGLMQIPAHLCPPELILFKRTCIQLKRQLKEMQ